MPATVRFRCAPVSQQCQARAVLAGCGNSGGQEERERSMYKTSLFWFVVATALLSLICVAGAVVFWDWLRPAVPYRVPNSETLRNVGLLVGGVLAFVFALWRVLVSEHQSGTAQRQANTAQQSLLHERYDRGAQMLGSSVLTVRLGGIYILARLASEHPAQYHVDVTRLFCVFVRLRENGNGVSCHPETDDEQDQQMPTLRADIQDVMQAIGSRSRAGIHYEQAEGFKLYLRDANVSHLQVQDAHFSGAWLTNANLSHAVMPRANLSYARLRLANFRVHSSGTQTCLRPSSGAQTSLGRYCRTLTCLARTCAESMRAPASIMCRPTD